MIRETTMRLDWEYAHCAVYTGYALMQLAEAAAVHGAIRRAQRPKGTISSEACATLGLLYLHCPSISLTISVGIKLVHKPHPAVTASSRPTPTAVVDPKPDYTVRLSLIWNAPRADCLAKCRLAAPRSRLKHHVGVAIPEGTVGQCVCADVGHCGDIGTGAAAEEDEEVFDASSPERCGVGVGWRTCWNRWTWIRGAARHRARC